MQQPDAHTMDYVVAIIAVGALIIGLISMLVGRAVAWWDSLQSRMESVKHSHPIMSPARPQTTPDEQTDRQTDSVSEADRWLDRLELDRTRTAVIELLLYSGWTITDLRREGILRGDNTAISAEVEAAKKKLGIVGEPRLLKVRDREGERMIPMESA